MLKCEAEPCSLCQLVLGIWRSRVNKKRFCRHQEPTADHRHTAKSGDNLRLRVGILRHSSHLQTPVNEVLVGAAEPAGRRSNAAVGIVWCAGRRHDVGCCLVQIGCAGVQVLLYLLEAAASMQKLSKHPSTLISPINYHRLLTWPASPRLQLSRLHDETYL